MLVLVSAGGGHARPAGADGRGGAGFAPLRSHVVAQLEDEEEPWVPNIMDMTLVSRAETKRGTGIGECGWGMP